jgi:hypothetical protein
MKIINNFLKSSRKNHLAPIPNIRITEKIISFYKNRCVRVFFLNGFGGEQNKKKYKKKYFHHFKIIVSKIYWISCKISLV